MRRHSCAGAVEGSSVTRVVLTSSIAAVASRRNDHPAPLCEQHWNASATEAFLPYFYSKTLAERRAWELAGKQERCGTGAAAGARQRQARGIARDVGYASGPDSHSLTHSLTQYKSSPANQHAGKCGAGETTARGPALRARRRCEPCLGLGTGDWRLGRTEADYADSRTRTRTGALTITDCRCNGSGCNRRCPVAAPAPVIATPSFGICGQYRTEHDTYLPTLAPPLVQVAPCKRVPRAGFGPRGGRRPTARGGRECGLLPVAAVGRHVPGCAQLQVRCWTA